MSFFFEAVSCLGPGRCVCYSLESGVNQMSGHFVNVPSYTETPADLLDRTNQEELQLVFPRASYQLTFETSDGVLDFINDLLILSRCLRSINLDHLTLRDIVSSHFVVDVCVFSLAYPFNCGLGPRGFGHSSYQTEETRKTLTYRGRSQTRMSD